MGERTSKQPQNLRAFLWHPYIPGWQKGKEGRREEFLHSERTETHAKGAPFPKEGRHSESCGVGSGAAFWGCPFASDWKWLQQSWMEVTAKGQSISSASLVNPKSCRFLKQYLLLGALSPHSISAEAWAGAVWGALPTGTMPPSPTLLPHTFHRGPQAGVCTVPG